MTQMWLSKKLMEVAEVIPSGVDKKSHPEETPVRLCNYLDVYNNDTIHSGICFASATATQAEIARCRLLKGDVVITKDSETPDDIAKPAVVVEDLPGVLCGYHLAILRPNRELVSGSFLGQFLRLPSFRKRLSQLANGAIRFGLTSSALNSIEVQIPPLAEQTRIALVLSTWDQAISALGNLITAKSGIREGLIQQVLGGSLRFTRYGKDLLEQVRLQDVMDKVAEPVTPVANELYREIGVRSHGKGIFHKKPVTGESLGNKRVYRVLPGCLTLNIVFAWERALGITTEREDGMIASHRFPMFRPKSNRILAEYALLYFISTKKGTDALELASPGGAGRNRTLSQTEFLKTTIPLPSLEEQHEIVDLVRTVDREISVLRRQLEILKTQKKGLMQKLLTGQVRVQP